MDGRPEKHIVINLQYEALHRWKTCNIEEVKYLKDYHRHIFYIEVHKAVSHNDRDIEIILYKKRILNFLNEKFDGFFGDMSCEDIAETLFYHFDLSYCKVLEDNENGALIKKL
jgi:regulatory protein YycI of two-component signal transduction system YycFG